MVNPIIEDTQVYKSKATTNYYNEPKICAGSTNTYDIYIKVSNLMPNQQYYLFLYCDMAYSEGSLTVYESLPFDPKTITWNTKVANKSDTPLCNMPVSVGWKTIIFTSSSDVFYIRICGGTVAYMWFLSMENTDNIYSRPIIIMRSTSKEKSKIVVDGIEYKTYEKTPVVVPEEPLTNSNIGYRVYCYLKDGSILKICKTDVFGVIDSEVEFESAYITDGQSEIPIYEKYTKIGAIGGYQYFDANGNMIENILCKYVYIKNSAITGYNIV